MTERSDQPEPASLARTAPQAAGRPRHTPESVAAFTAFYREQTPALVAFLVWQGANVSDAAEVSQHAMALLLQNWENVDHPRAWVRTVAGRAYARRLARLEEDPADEVPEPTPLLPPAPADDTVVGRHYVLGLLAALPLRQRQVMAWTFDGYSPSEIATELHMTPEAVRSSLAKARRSLVASQLADRKEDNPR